MFNIGVQEMALIGAVALVVIGPERLPRVARTAGALFGRAQRYVAEVKAEVNRAVDLDELRRMKQTIEEAGRDVEQSVREVQEDAQRELRELRAYTTPRSEALPAAEGDDDAGCEEHFAEPDLAAGNRVFRPPGARREADRGRTGRQGGWHQ